MTMKWKSESLDVEPWRGLTLEARCYLQSAAKPQYQKVTVVMNSGVEFSPNTTGCASGRFDAVDVKVSAVDGASSNFSRTMGVVLKGTQ